MGRRALDRARARNDAGNPGRGPHKRPDRAPRRWTLSRRRQVSWLAGQCGRPVFPRHIGLSDMDGPPLAAYSCGGSAGIARASRLSSDGARPPGEHRPDRTRVVSGKRGSVVVDLVVRRIIKKKKKEQKK